MIPSPLRRCRPLGGIVAFFFLVGLLHAQDSKLLGGPWGVSSSASSFKNYADWFPKMKAAGVTTVRLFPEWGSLEPVQGEFRWEKTDALVKTAAENGIEINAILMGATKWTKSKKSHAFPMNDLEAWSKFVAAVVGRYKDKIHYWEVWNEGNGAFNDDHHTTTDYANLVATTYAAAKKADPQAKIGITVASFDAAYINQTILALKKIGKAGSFDFLCIHPYELAGGLANVDGEVPYLWMTQQLREALKANAPERANAEIWITEIGCKVESKKGKVVTEDQAASALVKMYVMAIAQGVARIQWFEAQDPVGEESGFGLLKRDGEQRPSFSALKDLTTLCGARPSYQGWIAIGKNGRGYGFVFKTGTTFSLVAWMPANQQDDSMPFKSKAFAFSPLKNLDKPLTIQANDHISLNDTPIIVLDLPSDLVALAQANAAKPFPWGGDYALATAVSLQPGAADGNKGIAYAGHTTPPIHKFADGSAGFHIQNNQSTAYYVHPSFSDFKSHEYYVRVTVRRIGPGNVGMNLHYEVADSQGKSPYKNVGIWFGLKDDLGWQTHTWHITDASLSKMWGYDISFNPEKSVPFAIGKIEVSKLPLP